DRLRRRSAAATGRTGRAAGIAGADGGDPRGELGQQRGSAFRRIGGLGLERLRAEGPGAHQKSTGAGTGASTSTRGPTPSFSLIRFSSSSAMSGFSLRKVRTFSLP